MIYYQSRKLNAKQLSNLKKIELFLDDKSLYIVFVGSNNALKHSKQMLKNFPENHLLNLTSRLSFNQTAEVIKNSEVFLCCDGGLLHAATALNANIVALFARLTPEMLLTKKTKHFSLYNEENVNNISSTELVSSYYEAISFVDSHP